MTSSRAAVGDFHTPGGTISLLLFAIWMWFSKSLQKQTVCSGGGRGPRDKFSRENPEAQGRQLFDEAISGTAATYYPSDHANGPDVPVCFTVSPTSPDGQACTVCWMPAGNCIPSSLFSLLPPPLIPYPSSHCSVPRAFGYLGEKKFLRNLKNSKICSDVLNFRTENLNSKWTC